MGITELIKQTGDQANISISVGLEDLRRFGEELIQNTINRKDQTTSEKEEEFLTPIETCKFLRVTRSTLTRWQKSGYLVPIRLGGQTRYKKSSLEKILNK